MAWRSKENHWIVFFFGTRITHFPQSLQICSWLRDHFFVFGESKCSKFVAFLETGRKMDQVEVDVIEIQTLQRCLDKSVHLLWRVSKWGQLKEREAFIAFLLVDSRIFCYFGGDEQFFTFHSAALEPISQDLADDRFVFVIIRGVDVATARFQSAIHGHLCFFIGRLETPSSEFTKLLTDRKVEVTHTPAMFQNPRRAFSIRC